MEEGELETQTVSVRLKTSDFAEYRDAPALIAVKDGEESSTAQRTGTLASSEIVLPHVNKSTLPPQRGAQKKRLPTIWPLIVLLLVGGLILRIYSPNTGSMCLTSGNTKLAEFFFGLGFDYSQREDQLHSVAVYCEATNQFPDAERLYKRWLDRAPEGPTRTAARLTVAKLLDKEQKYGEADQLYRYVEGDLGNVERRKKTSLWWGAKRRVEQPRFAGSSGPYIAIPRLNRLLSVLSKEDVLQYFGWAKPFLHLPDSSGDWHADNSPGVARIVAPVDLRELDVASTDAFLIDRFGVVEVNLTPELIDFSSKKFDKEVFVPLMCGNFDEYNFAANKLPPRAAQCNDHACGIAYINEYTDQCLNLLNEVIHQAPRSLHGYVNKSAVLVFAEHEAEAATVLSDGIRALPNSALLYLLRSKCYYKMSKIPEATRDLLAGYKLDPTLARAYDWGKALTGEELGELLKAIGKGRVHENPCCQQIARNFFPERGSQLRLKEQVTNQQFTNLFPASPRDLVRPQVFSVDIIDYMTMQRLSHNNQR